MTRPPCHCTTRKRRTSAVMGHVVTATTDRSSLGFGTNSAGHNASIVTGCDDASVTAQGLGPLFPATDERRLWANSGSGPRSHLRQPSSEVHLQSLVRRDELVFTWRVIFVFSVGRGKDCTRDFWRNVANGRASVVVTRNAARSAIERLTRSVACVERNFGRTRAAWATRIFWSRGG